MRIARLERKQLEKEQRMKKRCCDFNADGVVGAQDFVNVVFGFCDGFVAFAFNKDVQALVVGIMIGGGLSKLANSVISDLLTPFVVSPLAGANGVFHNCFCLKFDVQVQTSKTSSQ